MSLCVDGIAAAEAGQQWPGSTRLAGALSLGYTVSGAGRTTLTFVGELDAASADQAYEYVRDAMDTFGGDVMLDVAGLRFCDACGLGALARMSSHAEQRGLSLRLVTPRPLLVKIIRITGLGGRLPVYRGDRA